MSLTNFTKQQEEYIKNSINEWHEDFMQEFRISYYNYISNVIMKLEKRILNLNVETTCEHSGITFDKNGEVK